MAAPFYNSIKGTTSVAAGTGAFTPSAAASLSRPWTKVPSGWAGLVRFEDGTNWELSWCFWNGTTLSRGTNQLFDSSSGGLVSLTTAATAALVISASDVMSHLGTTPWRGYLAQVSTGTLQNIGGQTQTQTGTLSSPSLASGTMLAATTRARHASATTANAQCGMTTNIAIGVTAPSASPGVGGFEYTARFGFGTVPTGPRLYAGMTSVSMLTVTTEPSAQVGNIAVFSKDSTDTNIQLMTNSGAGGCTKIDTGIPIAANSWYEASIWIEPGDSTTKVCALIIRLDTGAIFYHETTTDTPGAGQFMYPQLIGGLSSTTGTAMQLDIGSVFVRSGS